MKYSIYNIREELIATIFKNPHKYLNNYLVKLIKLNSEMNQEKAIVSYGFKFRGYYYFNPSLSFVRDKNNLSPLNENLISKLDKYKQIQSEIENDKQSISTFITSQCFNCQNNAEFFASLPSIFDSFIKRVNPHFERENEPEIRENLQSLFDSIITPKINYYESYELLV